MISSINTMGGDMSQFNAQAMQQRRDDLFNKIDTDGNGALDKAEFSVLAKRMSKDTGNSLNVDELFSTYDANADGTLTEEELNKFMEENAPPPPMGMSGNMFQMNTQAMQQRRDDLFNKIDSNSDGALDKSEFSAFVEKISEDTGNSLNVDELFSTYDANGDGALSKDELDNFMKENAPPPPPHSMQNAMSANGTSNGTDEISELIDWLKNQSANETLGFANETSFKSDLISKLIDMLNNGSNSDGAYSALNETVVNMIA